MVVERALCFVFWVDCGQFTKVIWQSRLQVIYFIFPKGELYRMLWGRRWGTKETATQPLATVISLTFARLPNVELDRIWSRKNYLIFSLHCDWAVLVLNSKHRSPHTDVNLGVAITSARTYATTWPRAGTTTERCFGFVRSHQHSMAVTPSVDTVDLRGP